MLVLTLTVVKDGLAFFYGSGRIEAPFIFVGKIMGYMSWANASIYHPVAIEVAKKKRAKKAFKEKFLKDCIARGASFGEAQRALRKHEEHIKAVNKAKYLKAKKLVKKRRLAKKQKQQQNAASQGSDRNPDQGTSSQET